jgi:acetyl esterase/lipase
VFVVGQSSGAHIASLALLDPHWLEPTGHTVNDIAGFIGISGVYDIVAQADFGRHLDYVNEFMLKFFECEENFALSSPLRHVRPGLPPMLLIHGDADLIVPVEVSASMHTAMLAAGNQCTYVVYPGGGHTEIMFEALATNPARLVTDIVSFVKQGETTN